MNNNSGLNPNIVKTALDKVFFQEFNGNEQPGYMTAESSSIFIQDSTDKNAVIAEIFKGSGMWESMSEEQDNPQGTFRVGNQQTFTVSKYAKSLDVSKNLFDDDQFSVVNRAISQMARRGRTTRDQNAMGIYRGAFTTTLTNDAATLISDTHTTLAGTTVDNKFTAAFSESSLNSLIISLVEQPAQDGVIDGSMPKTLLVPTALFKIACEVLDSDLRSGTANNDMNVYSEKYQISIGTSRYLGTAVTGGSNTAHFLLGDNHSVTRWVRQSMITTMVDWKFQRNDNYIFKGNFREVLGAMDYVGVVGSDGTV